MTSDPVTHSEASWPGPSQLVAIHPKMADMLAREQIRGIYGIKTPPPWLLCVFKGIAYRLRSAA